MTCKDCVHHDECDREDKLILTTNDLFELIYVNGVDRFCHGFKERSDDNDSTRDDKSFIEVS